MSIKKKIFCEKIIDGDGKEYTDLLLEFDVDNVLVSKKKIKKINHLSKEVERLDGIVCPGFVNVHCHLEWSYVQEKIKPNQGLVPFLLEMITIKNKEKPPFVTELIQHFDQKMWQNGIVAVGDICNTNLSIKIKKESKIFYHNFLELIGLDKNKLNKIIEKGQKLKNDFRELRHSFVPHAPYSTSMELIQWIANENDIAGTPFSIHSQESNDENTFFEQRKGKFVDLYKTLGSEISFFKKQNKNSLGAIFSYLPKRSNTILIHNTYSQQKDINLVKNQPTIYFGFCPSANLYLENKLPDFNLFKPYMDRLCIGTDGLVSNDSLDIFKEMRIIQENFSDFSLHELVQMATLNGARFLGIDNYFGDLKEGKKPGLNQLIINNKGLLERGRKILI